MRTLGTVAAAAQAKMAAENFPVALRVLPRTVRDDLIRLYVFARFVDDVGDDPDGVIGDAAHRLELLDLITADLARLPDATLPPVAGLAPLVAGGRVPPQPFLDLVEANRQDQRISAYARFDDLLDYCRLSAAPVGRVVLHVAGAASLRNVADSDAVCAGLQVLEHCQDVGEDARAGRVYLPRSDLARAGVDPAELTGTLTSPAVRAAVAEQVGRARELLGAGRPLLRQLTGWARFAVAGYIAGGLATADALDAADYDVLACAVTPSKARTATHTLLLLARRR